MRLEVQARLDRFVERAGRLPVDEAARRLLQAIAESGDFLTDLLCADPAALPALAGDPWLWQSKPGALIEAAVDQGTAGATDFADFKRRLRLVRRGEVLRIGARELGWGTTLEVARELSAFAEACLQAAWRFCDAELRREYGPPVTEEEGPAGFVVIAMGKLGGEELNFSSDVDVCYFYSSDAGAAGRVSLHQYFSELSRRITTAIEERTAEGMIFRVDLRLRPEGQNGPLCNSLPAAERYYETFGRTWERQALLRARPCAGDLAFGRQLLEALDAFIYPRHIEDKMVDEIRALRGMFRAQGDAAAGAGGSTGFDVKLGSGGIRDVELVVQTLQLLHAGKRRDLRDRTTLSGLRRLLIAGLISDREAKALSAAYLFWRRLEHRVQVEDGAQTHRLPGDDDRRGWFAQRLGYADLASFDRAVAGHRAAVQAIAATFNDPPPEAGDNVRRLLDPMLARDELEALLASLGFSDIEAAAGSLELVRGRIPPAFVEQAVASPDPSRALVHFRDLTVRGSTGLMALLRDHPQLLRMLATLFGTSERLSTLLIQRPELWQSLVDNLGARARTGAEMARDARARLAEAPTDSAVVDDDPDSAQEWRLHLLRRFQAEEMLRIGLHDVSGNLEPAEVSNQLTALAEVCLAEVVATVLPALAARHGQPGAALTVLGLGSLGAREMRYGSDLDLVFLYGGEGESTTGVDHREWYARAGQRVIGALEALTEDGRLYHVDTRLRPSGEQGMLVTSYAAFQRYHEREAAGWERAALLRARVVWSGEAPPAAETVAAMVAGIAHDRPFDEQKFRDDLRAVRQRVEKERGRVPVGSRHLRFDPGGIMDIEFLVALGQLQAHGADAALRTTNTAAALGRLLQLGWPAALAEDYALLRRLAVRLRLLRDRPEDVLSPADNLALARTFEREPAALLDELDRRMARVREIFRERF